MPFRRHYQKQPGRQHIAVRRAHCDAQRRRCRVQSDADDETRRTPVDHRPQRVWQVVIVQGAEWTVARVRRHARQAAELLYVLHTTKVKCTDDGRPASK